MKKGSLWTIYGGQYGSEGKGQVCMFLSQKASLGIKHAVRVGGPNAGHTSYVNGNKVVVQSIPSPSFLPGMSCSIGPEGLLLVDLLQQELRDAFKLRGSPVPLEIDAQTGIILQKHMDLERDLRVRIGSTGEGVGAATVDRVMRDPEVVIKNQLERLHQELSGEEAFEGVALAVDTVTANNKRLLEGQSLIIEGTQGYGLSLLTSGFYPYCTSRECTPLALWAGTGINPANAGYVESVMVIRTYPIRVGGNSGPLENEISWDQLREESGGYVQTPEITTVTKKQRRIARLDFGLLERAVLQTRPDSLALTFVDYEFPHLSCRDPNGDEGFLGYVDRLESQLGVPVAYASTGPGYTYDVDASL